LAYPIGGTLARSCIDLPADMDRGKEAVIGRIREGYLPALPAGVREPISRALHPGGGRKPPHQPPYTHPSVVPGAALVGDAAGCSHPLTATGMTIALTDVRLLARALHDVELADGAATDRALARYQAERYRYARAREILADALYEVFRGVDDGTR